MRGAWVRPEAKKSPSLPAWPLSGGTRTQSAEGHKAAGVHLDVRQAEPRTPASVTQLLPFSLCTRNQDKLCFSVSATETKVK